MRVLPLFFLASIALLSPSPSFAQSTNGPQLTPSQVESIVTQLEALKNSLDSHLTTRNTGAYQQFAQAATDPRAAFELYLKCHKLVRFDREGRPESDYRAWAEGERDRARDDEFMQSLMISLSYLALSCEAAEAETIDAIFPKLLNHVDGLSRLEEVPSGPMNQSVASSIFAKAFYLEKLLGSNEGWEPTPFNIGGIYTKTILPYLRTERPEALLAAWDKRIEQETRIVMMLEAAKEKELRGMDRDEERRARNRQNNAGGVLRDLDKDDFVARTLPRLKWDRLKDQFQYVDQVMGAKNMLDFVGEHLTHELGETFYEELMQMLESVLPPPGAEPGVPIDAIPAAN